MGLFSPYKDKQPAAAPVQPTDAGTPARASGKDAPTPSRKAAEAARRQRINPRLTPKEARRKARQDSNAEQRKRMAAVEASPGKVLFRDFIDSRRNLAEWWMPALLVLLALSMFVAPLAPDLAQYTSYATFVFMLAVVVDLFVMWRRFKALLAQRLPNEPRKGLLYYGFNRAISPRRFRFPAARVKRGDPI